VRNGGGCDAGQGILKEKVGTCYYYKAKRCEQLDSLGRF